MYSTDIGLWKLFKSRGKRWDLPKLAIPLFKVMSSHISLMSTLAIPKYHILFIVHHIYIYKCSSFLQAIPPSLPYFIIVQTCGKRWDLPKFVDVLYVNLGFSQSLICSLTRDVRVPWPYLFNDLMITSGCWTLSKTSKIKTTNGGKHGNRWAYCI